MLPYDTQNQINYAPWLIEINMNWLLFSRPQ